MIASQYAPIAIFVYNRPDHTQKTLQTLLHCPEYNESPVYIFCDGSKVANDDNVNETRKVVRQLVGEKAIIIESKVNQGLAKSIINGVTKLCADYGRVIVLEDDLLVAPDFLKYMNDALNTYESDQNVMQVSGYMFDVPELANQQEAIFLPFTSSWGWATWSRAWDAFDPDANGWRQLKTDKKLRVQFNLDNSYDYYSMFKKQMKGKIDSWAIRWYWSVFKQDGLVLYPPSTLVNNIGFDGSGTHGWRSAKNNKYGSMSVNTSAYQFPNLLEVNNAAYQCVKAVLRKAGYGVFSKGFQICKGILRGSW